MDHGGVLFILVLVLRQRGRAGVCRRQCTSSNSYHAQNIHLRMCRRASCTRLGLSIEWSLHAPQWLEKDRLRAVSYWSLDLVAVPVDLGA